MKQNKKVIGLTGNIASGKSTVSDYLKEKGFAVIDADKIAREVVEPGKVGLENIIEEFGDVILNEDGSLNRKKMSELVFNNQMEMKKLNSILHPLIRMEILERIDYEKDSIIFIDAALLYETHLDELVDQVWFVSVDKEIQLRRLMERDCIDEENARKRMASQIEQSIKIQKSDIILNNNFTIEALYHEIDDIIFSIGLDKARS
ncbi:MAG: dephospho-CoA kinase [Clostridiales bacterium]|nr:dephospho-CoA kinase [Clostridiales bacterium]